MLKYFIEKLYKHLKIFINCYNSYNKYLKIFSSARIQTFIC